MNSAATSDCLICRKHRGEATAPGGPREYWGPKVDEWPDAPRGGEAEIAPVADRLREYLREHFGTVASNRE
jgi:hypothetical protein